MKEYAICGFKSIFEIFLGHFGEIHEKFQPTPEKFQLSTFKNSLISIWAN